MATEYPLNVVEVQFLDKNGNVLLRLPDPIFMKDGVPTIQIKIPAGFDLSNVVSVKEVLDGQV